MRHQGRCCCPRRHGCGRLHGPVRRVVAAPYWDIDTGFAALLMWLTAADAGLAACFFDIPADRIESFRSAFAVPPQFTPIGAISIGYDDEPSAKVGATRERVRAMRKPLAQTVHRGRWNLPVTEPPS